MPRLFVVSLFAYRFRVQAKNPSLDIALWNQPRDPFCIGVNNRFSAVEQCLIELPQPVLNRIRIRIDDHYQFSSGTGLTAAILARFLYKLSPDPIFSASCARWGLPNSNL